MILTLRKHGNTQKWKRFKILPLSFWEKHKKPKALWPCTFSSVGQPRGKLMSRPISSKAYGTVSADRRKEMSGLEFVQGLVDGTLPLNMIAQTLGYDVIEAEKGRVVVTVEPSDAHLNPYGTVHGGLAAT